MGNKANWHKAKHGLITKAKISFGLQKQEEESSKNGWGEKCREEKKKKRKRKRRRRRKEEEFKKEQKVWNYEFLYEFPYNCMVSSLPKT